MNADTLINHYSQLSRKEQREFDRRYKTLKEFSKTLNLVVSAISKHPEKAAEIINALKPVGVDPSGNDPRGCGQR